MDHMLKPSPSPSFLNDVFSKTIHLLLYLAGPGLGCGMQNHFSCHMWDLVPWPESKPRPPALGAWSLSHWTTREVSLNDVDNEMVLSLPLAPFSPVQEWRPRILPWLDSQPQDVCQVQPDCLPPTASPGWARRCHWLHCCSSPSRMIGRERKRNSSW